MSKNKKFSISEPEGEDCVWVKRFTHESLSEFYDKFTKLEADPTVSIIPVIVASYGGDANIALGMRDIIKGSPKPVATMAVGMAMSAGALILASGTKGYRFASAEVSIMVHEVWSIQTGKFTDIKNETRYTENLNRRLLACLASDMGCKPAELEKKMHSLKNADWYMEAAEAVRWGLIDRVGIPRVSERTSASMLLIDQPRPLGKKKPKR